MDSRTETLKAELKRLHTETAERVVCRRLDSLVVPLYRFCWGNNSKRATMQGRLCRVICRGAMNSARIEFLDNGQREVISRNALRRHNEKVRRGDE